MNKNLKIHKLKKTELTLKQKDFIFFFQTTNLTSTDKLKIEQEFYKKNVGSYKTHNNSTKIVLQNSIFLNFSGLINSSSCLNFYNNKFIDNNFRNSSNFNSIMILTAVKINKKIYSTNQLKKLLTINYLKNITLFNKTLKKIVKQPYYTLKN
jgi:hypothetical protein